MGLTKKMRSAKRMRNGLLNLIRRLQVGLTMVEIGSYAGESAELFALSGKFSRIVCVDNWDSNVLINGEEVNSSAAEAEFDLIAEMYPVIEKQKMTSQQVVLEFDDESIDFVYIDSVHKYVSVKTDIMAWRKKTKEWFGGHDFCLNFPGVIQAVREEFVQPITVFQDDSWLVRLSKYPRIDQ